MLSSNYSFSSVSSCTSQRRGEISSKEKKLTELVVLVTVLAYKVESRWRQSLDIFVLPASFVRGERRKKIKICYFIFFPLRFSNWLPLDVRWPAQNFRVEHVEEGVGCVPPLALIFCLAVSCSFNWVVKEKRWDQKIRRPKFSHVYLVL